MNRLPIALELSSVPDVAHALQEFSKSRDLLLLESARRDRKLGRYSFLCFDPEQVFVLKNATYGCDPFEQIRELSQESRVETIPDLPPFQGGFAGLLSYELGHAWEELPNTKTKDEEFPDLVVGVYRTAIAWDHEQDRCWVFSHGDSKLSGQSLVDSAETRAEEIRERLETLPDSTKHSGPQIANAQAERSDFNSEHFNFESTLQSNFSREQYLQAVQKVNDYIYAGDLFQANLSQRMTANVEATAVEIYLQLRAVNPAPFAGLFQHDDWAVISSSPERFLQKSENRVWTRPIKGTRQRYPVPEADLFTREELRESLKDQSENLMIVDLLRNDLSRVCLPGTVKVPELCSIETYETVTHLVSEVTGQLREEFDFWDLVQATFPGGSITGAPKIRAMEIISELEGVPRGAYCGSFFYCGFDGTADSSILIRTLTQRGQALSFSVGGGIVANSSPSAEYEETLHKAKGMIDCVRRLNAINHPRNESS
ncbi:Aminodeoxychorismate synthase component 1 [Thalassoglobus neptunius]|uniref:aminodeoxychorismate synthase n=1 Tax=Thalassoglobus neptunius TaxID=1938619 RepID=A0A5C5WBB7_9PLAN|nr:aminodeoxychorismate synthase component I [Thalassoglobus neptunius]TWT47970.1 Aminodeoxychorismate synthase component 1 [Thalassoglobus neptunius]